MIILSHAVVVLALTLEGPITGLAVQSYPSPILRQASLRQFEQKDARWYRPQVMDDAITRAAPRAPLVPKRGRFQRWLPWVGAAVGGTLIGVGVADEEDIVPSGKVAWVGIGAAAGATVGWVIARLAGP